MPVYILVCMLKNQIYTTLVRSLEFPLTAGQEVMLDRLAGFIASGEEDMVFLLKGYAGTGKTTMIRQLVLALETFRIPYVLLAPTGRAAKVLMNYTGRPAYTIHKKIYRQKQTVDASGLFVLDKNLLRSAVFIVDEASMISNQSPDSSLFGSGKLLDDLLEYVFTGPACRLVLSGDTAQLPPVGIPLSPALDANVLQQYGFQVIECELKEVVRQGRESSILRNATSIREVIAENRASGFLHIDLQDGGEIEKLSGGDLIEKIGTSYEQCGIYDTAILTRSNKRANLFNKGIRNSVLYRESEISRGDLLMIVRNNYFWASASESIDFIANGDLAEIMHIYGYESLYGFRFANVSLRFMDYGDAEMECKIMLDTLEIESAALSQEDYQRLFYTISEDYIDIRNKRERWKKIREDPYFNALQVKYGYAITCHKAQGGQWKSVFVDTGYLTPEMLDMEFYRWLYTAFTRPVEKLYLVNFDKRFFEKGS